MENKINIAELLKYCPSGMPLDCAMWDNLYFDRVEYDMIYCYYELDGYRNSTIFCKDGCYSAHKLSKCVIFPKGKTTWEGFVQPVTYKDGDILVSDNESCIYIYIYNGVEDIFNHGTYVSVNLNGSFLVNNKIRKNDSRFATEEEKEILFKIIEERGYKWYQDTKSLVKLFKPNFKVGDRIRNKTDKYLAERTIETYVEGIGYFTTIKDWVRITDQDNWELVPNKFDINTLKPFDKVLVRNYKKRYWIPAFWGFEHNGVYNTTNGWDSQCVPYEGNEHLLGTTDDCDEYFKNWEEEL